MGNSDGYKKKNHKKNRAVKAFKPQTSIKRRIWCVFIAFMVFFAILTVWLFTRQIIMGPQYQKKALGQWTRATPLSAARGEILDRNGKVLATNGSVYKIVIWPELVHEDEKDRIATELSNLLNISYDRVLSAVNDKDHREVVLARQVSAETAQAVNSLKMHYGVGIADDIKRFYPYGSMLSQVLGFTNVDNAGQSGLELTLDKFLAGSDGSIVSETDRNGNPIAGGAVEYINPKDGNKVYLTVDDTFQSLLEDTLKEALTVNNASNAQGIIMDVTDGSIMALSVKPDYDPNFPPRHDYELLASLSRNRIATDVYEPGSTFKILTLAAALDSGCATPDSHFYCNGGYIVNGERIKCWKHAGHGSQDLTTAAENSCNSCFMKLALDMGTEKFYDYLYSFGLGSSTGSDLIGEASGIVTPAKYITENDLARIGFGQSIAVTPLQLATAVSAAVNGGTLYTPHIVDKIVSPEGETVFKTDTAPVREVIRPETSAIVREILQSVVDNGTGRNAKIDGYAIGGKTGTAQKYDKYGAVSTGSYICSFIGFAPAENPKYLCLILVDEPKVGPIFGSTVAAPYVRRVFEGILPYSGILPSGSSETVVLPNLSGMTCSEAKAALEEIGLYALYECDEPVMFQIPAAGQSVPAGSSVLLYTGFEGQHPEEDEESEEPLYVVMPDLEGMTPLQAYDTLKALGLKMLSDPEDPFGIVVNQSIPKGTNVEYGSGVTVWFGIKQEE